MVILQTMGVISVCNSGQRWHLKYPSPMQWHYYFKQAVLNPEIFFPILWPSCGRSTNLIGSQYGHPPNLLDYALNWEFVELILFPALSSLLLVRLFSSSFHICLPSPQLLFPALLYLFRLELLQACTSSCLLLLLWLWPVQSPDSRFPLGIKNDCKFRWLLDSFSSCASVTNDVLTSTM